MIHPLRRSLVLLAAVCVLLGAFASTAYANLDSEPTNGLHGFSESNPGAGEDYWWRQGWGRSLHPDMALTPPEGMDYIFDGYIIGMLYSVDRMESGCVTGTASDLIINRATPDNYDRASYGGATNNTGPYGMNTDNTIDLLGIYYDRIAGGAIDPSIEGRWYVHYRYFSSRESTKNPDGSYVDPNFGYSDAVHTVGIGIDTTPPRPVQGLRIRTGVNSPDVTTWQPATRARISWTPGEYDDLSGVGYFEVLVDGKPLVPESTATPTPQQGRVYSAPWLANPSSITIENMPAGKHEVSVVSVDRATNRSVAATGTYYSDPDTPTVAFTRPTNGLIKETLFISADASDAAGPPMVTFRLDSTNIATFTAPPYQFKPNLSGVLPGAHVLYATATDMLGRSVTTSIPVSTLSAVIPPSEGYIVTDDLGFNVDIAGTSPTNPNNAVDADVFWRQGWGNSVKPQFTITPPAVDPANLGFVTGMLYSLSRTPSTVIDPAQPSAYYKSSRGEGTNLDQTVDLLGVYRYPPAGGWPASGLGGEVQPYEGLWYFNFLPFTTMAYVPQNTYHVAFGIDVTKPRIVTGLLASPSLSTAEAWKWTAASRAHVTWDADRYDDLSGVAYYKVYVDDKLVIPEGAASTQGRVYEVFGRTPTSVTLENMPAGTHKISIVAVDRATNEGPVASTYFNSDPDIPKVAFLTPTSSILQVKPSLTATASDMGGVKSVTYKVDGVTVGSATYAPYALTPDLSGFAAGTHTLSATVTDMLDRTATVSRTITLDKTPVRISGFSRNYSLFYPILRDGYYDNLTVRYTLNKSANVTLTIRDSKGVTRRTMTASKGAGSSSFVWDGKWSSDKKAHTGTYTVQITAIDAAAYTAATSKLSTTIRNYELVKTGTNTVKVVPR